MLKVLLSAALMIGAGSAVAGELDNEGSVTNQGLNGTVVVRVDSRDKSVAMSRSEALPRSANEAQVLAKNSSFSKLPASKVRNELDRDGGASSWYWYCSPFNYGYNSLYWYGYNYQPYYAYNYGYYSYYYYNRWTWGW